MSRYLTAKQATEILGISPATLYAYVSRGLIRSEAVGADSRARRYHTEDVRKLKERKEQRKNPARVIENALHWGAPLLESALTLITDDGLYYRGYDALELATTHTVEQVAALFWTGEMARAETLFAGRVSIEKYLSRLELLDSVALASGGSSRVSRLVIALTLASADDLAAYDLQPDAIAHTGVRILRLMAGVLANYAVDDWSAAPGIPQQLGGGWGTTGTYDADLLNAALVLCADHELNVSSFTARVVASADALPYHAVIAGLMALQGLKHGGNTVRVEAMLREIQEPDAVYRNLAERLRRGERLPGFGHRLYVNGDPRAKKLLELTRQAYPESPVMVLAQAVIDTVQAMIDRQPNVDFALAVLARALHLPADASFCIFALGRTIGWIGHAIEQYAQGDLIRPRASYVGPPMSSLR